MSEPKTLDDCAWACGIELGVVVGNVMTPDNEEAIGIIRAALREAVAERDKEWRAKIDTEGRTAVNATLKEAVAEERKALREMVLGCRNDFPLGGMMCDKMLTALDAREKESR